MWTEPRSLARGAIANVQATGLIIGAVRGAGHFAVLAVLAATGHPGLEIVLAIGRPPARVARAYVEDARGMPSDSNKSSSIAKSISAVNGIRRIPAWCCQREHLLDLGELVNATKSAAGLGLDGSRPSVRKQCERPDVLNRQIRLVQYLGFSKHSTQRDISAVPIKLSSVSSTE